MDQFVCVVHRRDGAEFSGGLLLADRHPEISMVDETLRYLRLERNRAFCRLRCNGKANGINQGYRQRWETSFVTHCHLPKCVCFMAAAISCLAGLRDLFHPRLARTHVDSLPPEDFHKDLRHYVQCPKSKVWFAPEVRSSSFSLSGVRRATKG